MQEGHSEPKRAQVWTVRRRLAERAARLGVGLLVLPVVLSMIDVALEALAPHFWGSNDAGKIASGVLIATWMGTWMFASPLSFFVALFASLRSRLPHSAVSVKEGDLELSGDALRTVPRSRIDSAMVVAPPDKPRHVEIDLKNGDVLQVQTGGAQADDRALVEALGFGGKQRRTSVPLGGTRGPLWDGLTALGVGMVATMVSTCTSLTVSPNSVAAAAIISGVVFLVTVLSLSRIFSPRRVVAGADGLAVEATLRRTFYPRDRVFGVEKLSTGVAVLLRGAGEKVTPLKLPVDTPERTDALYKTLTEALEMGANEESEPIGALLARGGEPVRAWRERLRKLVAPVGDYRAQKISVEALVRTAKDPSSPPELRIGAALAIAESGDADAKKRLRIATEGIVSEGVKSALEAAVEGEAEDEAIAEACERAEKEARIVG
ncbi:MAG: hypothetical protein U0441_00805 [Polyangiaceae bacterium]